MGTVAGSKPWLPRERYVFDRRLHADAGHSDRRCRWPDLNGRDVVES